MSHPLTAPTPAFNIPGIIGLLMVTIAAILSPVSIFGVYIFLYLLLLGFAGLFVCALGAFLKPRWPAVAGLVIGVGTLIFWVGFFIYAIAWPHP